MVLLIFVLVVGAAAGFVVGRWLTLLVVPPGVTLVLGLGDSVLPASLHWWVAFVAGAFSALGVAGGMLIRRLVNRNRSPT